MKLEVELDKIIENKEIITVFQPIVDLRKGEIIGYEALSRGPANSPLSLPDSLFQAAENYNRSWELESLCRVKAIEKASTMSKDKFLFLNVDPMIFKDDKFKKGFTKEFLAQHNVSCDSIIFEITEKTAIEDYKSFKCALDNYVNQGYKIAIDDTGAGYSGLKTLSETKPHYIKIDMDLVRDIDKDPFKQAIMKTFVSLSNATNMKLIAEGIETEEELRELIDLGVYGGQGFFISKPAGAFLDIPEEIKNLIIKLNKPYFNKNIGYENYIGYIAKRNNSFTDKIFCQDLKQYFEKEGSTGICIVEDNKPIGLVMKHRLDSILATQYGIAVFSKRNVSLIMDHSPLIIDYYTPVNFVSKLAMERDEERLYDYIIVTRNSEYYGTVAIKDLLQYITILEKNYARELNPLTGLPGNSIIEKNISNILECNFKTCLLYFDLDNFKAYNDSYGFENGDRVIKFTASLIQKKIKKDFPFNGFVGHIGGDDFVCILEASYENCSVFCYETIADFNNEVLQFFNEYDKNMGYFQSTDRKGNKDIFNLTSMSIAGIYGNFKNFSSPEDVGQSISQIKKNLKSLGGNKYSIIKI